MNINLKNNMTDHLITVPADSGVEKALMVMKNHHIRHLPVLGENKKIVGVVSDRDLYRGLNSDDIFVSDIMTKDVFKVDIKTNIKVVIESMLKHKFSAVLVTQDDVVCGIITSEDLLSLLLKLLDSNDKSPTLLEEAIILLQGFSQTVKNPNLVSF